MSFVVFMICMVAALFFGAVLDRMAVIKNRMKPKESFANTYDRSSFDKNEYAYASSIIFKSKIDSESIFPTLERCLMCQKVLRVYDLYLLANIRAKPDDFFYGWNSVSDFKIEPHGDGWLLSIPKPFELTFEPKN